MILFYSIALACTRTRHIFDGKLFGRCLLIDQRMSTRDKTMKSLRAMNSAREIKAIENLVMVLKFV